MAKIEVIDECMGPDKYARLDYSGPDPWGVVKKIDGLAKPFFHVSSIGFNNYKVKWDVVGDNIEFYSQWWVKRDFSRFSDMYIDIKVQGFKNKKTNAGKFSLLMWAQVQTGVSGMGLFLKPFWVVYSYLFYNKLRRKFIQVCNSRVLQFKNELKEHFNIGATEVPSAEGVYG